MSFHRGDVYWVSLDPTMGSEQRGRRPCLIISRKVLNDVRNTVVIIPLTTTPSPAIEPLLIELPSLTAASKARIDQVRAIDKSRIRERLGQIGKADLESVSHALRAVLDL